MGQPKRIAIIGGSIAGLFTGRFLKQLGHEVVLFERSGNDLQSRGAGIVAHDALFHALKLAGADLAPDQLGVAVEGRQVFTADGQVHYQPNPQYMACWNVLYQKLLAQISFKRVIANIQSLTETTNGKILLNSEQDLDHAFDYVILATGAFSRIDAPFLHMPEPEYAGYVAWRGLAPIDSLGKETRHALSGRVSFYLPDNEEVLAYPVKMAEPDGQLQEMINYVWYRPAAGKEQQRIFTGKDGQLHRHSINPDLINDGETTRLLDRAQDFPAPFRELIFKTPKFMVQEIVDVVSDSTVSGSHKNVIQVGDAAFVARPHTGLGVTKAAIDALYLRDAFAVLDNEGKSIAHFAVRQSHLGISAINRGRQLGRYLGCASRNASIPNTNEPDRMSQAFNLTAEPLQAWFAPAAIFQ